MKISTKGRYALRLMVDLALNNTGEPISLKDIARKENISDKYLEQIISVLNKAGYVRSIRGAQGGYMLRKKPEDYTVGMILRQTEGSLAPVACLEDEDTECERVDDCVSLIVYRKLNNAINEVVDGITLADLVDWTLQTGEISCRRMDLPLCTLKSPIPGLTIGGKRLYNVGYKNPRKPI